MTQTQTREARQAVEDEVIRRVLCGVIEAGCSVTVTNGEDAPISTSRDVDAIMRVLRQTDNDMLLCWDAQGVSEGYVWLVYCNDPCEVVADWTANLEPAMTEAMAYAASLM